MRLKDVAKMDENLGERRRLSAYEAKKAVAKVTSEQFLSGEWREVLGIRADGPQWEEQDPNKEVAAQALDENPVLLRPEPGSPAETYREALPYIALALSYQAKAGSYLHAKALKELAEEDSGKPKSEKSLVRVLLERLDGEGGEW